MLIILILSILPGKDLPYIDFWDIIGSDKLAHLAVYAALSYLYTINIGLSRSKYKGTPAVPAIIAATLYGIGMELVQELFFVSREADLYDVLSNFIGAMIGTVMVKYLPLMPWKVCGNVQRLLKKYH